MNEDFATIGRQIKAKSGAYSDLPDEVVGQAYLKKTNPLQYELYKSQVDLQKTQATSDIQAQKELDVSGAKLQQQYNFEQTHPKALSPSEQSTLEENQQKKAAAEKSKKEAISLVNDLLNRDIGAVTGAKNPLKYLTGEAQYTKALLDQLKAKLSLESRSLLKGTGQISDKETQMLEEAVAALATNKKGSYLLKNEDLKKELLRIKQNLGGEVSQTPDVSTKPYSAGEFVQNAGQDVKSIVAGVLGIPGYLEQKAQESKQTLQDPNASLLDKYKASTPLGILLETGKGIGKEYGDLASDPIGHAYNKPVSTVLDILPFIKGGKAIMDAKAAQTADIAGQTGEASKIVTGVEKAKSYLPQNIFARKQAEAAANTVGKVEIDPQRIINAGKKFAETDIDAAKRLPIEEPAIKNIKDVPTLLERMQVWGSKTYGAKGLKATAKADLYNKFYQEGLNILKESAPEVYKNRQFLRYTFELPQAAGKLLWRATLGRILTGGV